jgi:rRNA small subunit pseudouridine methyltransferase Nep1
MVVTLIFFESALELIPENLRNHPLVRKEWKMNVRKKNRGILLDTALHSFLMANLPDQGKRGRPDIVYYSLLNSLYSPLVKNRSLEVIIHTYQNKCIDIPFDWRIPVNFNRFVGLFSQLLHTKQIPVEGESILSTSDCTLEKLLDEKTSDNLYLLESPTEASYVNKDLSNITLNNSTFLIGGFQSGSPLYPFNEKINKFPNLEQISLYNDVKPAWVVTSKLIHLLESRLLT